MQQLLESIQKISQATSDKICFVSHIFVDGAVRAKEMTEFALQLIGLLNDTLRKYRNIKTEKITLYNNDTNI